MELMLMSKAILMSIKPKYVSMILNKIKTIEVRKRFPSDYVGWVYIYCTKAKHYTDWLVNNTSQNLIFLNDMKAFGLDDFSRFEHLKMLNGKVVARFWCGKVGVIKLNYCLTVPTIAYTTFADKYYSDSDLQVASCLNGNELMKYLGTDKKEVGFAIPISQLEIFDTPKELSEFENYNMVREVELNAEYYKGFDTSKITVVKKAPQSWQYIEI